MEQWVDKQRQTDREANSQKEKWFWDELAERKVGLADGQKTNRQMDRQTVDLPKTARTIHQCRKTTVLRCHRCLINTGIEKMNNI